MKNQAKTERGGYRGVMARGQNKETEAPHEDKRRDQMALKEKQLMKEDDIDKGGENDISAFSSGLAGKTIFPLF